MDSPRTHEKLRTFVSHVAVRVRTLVAVILTFRKEYDDKPCNEETRYECIAKLVYSVLFKVVRVLPHEDYKSLVVRYPRCCCEGSKENEKDAFRPNCDIEGFTKNLREKSSNLL